MPRKLTSRTNRIPISNDLELIWTRLTQNPVKLDNRLSVDSDQLEQNFETNANARLPAGSFFFYKVRIVVGNGNSRRVRFQRADLLMEFQTFPLKLFAWPCSSIRGH